MIHSMTGYGKGAASRGGRTFTVEMKSVNHRYGEISVRLPRVMNAYEDKLRGAIAQAASRGKIDVFVRYESTAAEDVSLKLNVPLAEAYAMKLVELKRSMHSAFADDFTLTTLARFPDVITAADDADGPGAESLWPILQDALNEAITQFTAMRRREGDALLADLSDKSVTMGGLVNEAALLAPTVAAKYWAKLEQKVRDLLDGAEVDEARLLTEVTIFADKTAIDEELTRLKSHLSQFDGMLAEGGAIGRKLDFLIQEMNREANTIASKANDIALSKIAVEMKGEIEKIREQAQNIE